MARHEAVWAIGFDVDSYLTRGGKLLDLIMIPSKQQMAIIAALPWSDNEQARMVRVAKFLQRVGKEVGDERVEDTFTEREMQKIWRETLA